MIAESPDATLESLSCGWCERPLGGPCSPSGSPRRCGACGARMGVLPAPSLTPLLAREDAAVAASTASAGGERGGCALAEALRRRAHRRIALRIERMAPPGPVLDVRPGLDVTELGGRYAAIVFWQSLGAAPAPRTALEHAAALLKPAGLLTVAQPTPGLPALTERLRRAERSSAPPLRIPQRALVERLRALGLEILHADRVGAGVAGWSAALVGGVVSVEARR